jgi:hypothetical protein
MVISCISLAKLLIRWHFLNVSSQDVIRGVEIVAKIEQQSLVGHASVSGCCLQRQH